MDRLERAEAIGLRLDRNPRFRRNLLLIFRLDCRPNLAHLENSLRRAGTTWQPLVSALRPYPCDVLTPQWVPDNDAPGRTRLASQGAPIGPMTESRLQTFAPTLVQPFDPQAPLWEIREDPDPEGGGSSLLLKVHPLVAGNLDWLSQLLEPGREAEPGRHEARLTTAEQTWFSDLSTAAIEEMGGHLGRLRQRLARAPAMARAPRQTLEDFLEQLKAAASIFGGGRRLPDTRPGQAPFLASLTFPWADIEECARVTRSSPREIVMTALAGSVAAQHPRSVSCGIEDADFPWVAHQILLTSTSPDPRRRIRELQTSLRRADVENARTFLPEVAEVLDRLPQPLLEAAADEAFASSDFRCDLQPGLPVTAFLGGARIHGIRSFQTTRGHRLAASLIRSLDELSIGLTIDSRAFPNPEPLVEEFQRQLRELLRLAG